MTAPRTPIVEAKVKTASAAAAAVGLVLALLSQYVFSGGPVPGLVAAIVEPSVTALVTGAIVFVAGWLARHTPREVVDITLDQE